MAGSYRKLPSGRWFYSIYKDLEIKQRVCASGVSLFDFVK